MEIQRLVAGAKLGDNDDFSALVRLFQHRLLAMVEAQVRDRATAEDLVQEAFVRAWSGLESLKNAEAFPGWLWAIARNLIRSQGRLSSRHEVCAGFDLDLQPDPRSYEDVGGSWAGGEAVLGLLNADQRQLVALRHGAGLSLRQIGAVLGIPEARVKSRLFTLRRSLVKRWGELPPRSPFLEEKIMDKIQTLRLGAHVFERLSLAAQTRFTQAVLGDQALGEQLLAEIGHVDRGTEFVTLYGSRLSLPELVGILNHVDRFTEGRLIDHLEVVAPAQAEKVKQNLFVFEDIVLLDPAAVRLLVGEVDRTIFAVALNATESRVKDHVLSSLPSPDREDLDKRVRGADGERHLVRGAQESVVNLIRDLEKAGRLAVRRHGDVPDGEIYLTVP